MTVDGVLHTLFGAANALDDDLLDSCYLAPLGVTKDQTIIVGKWGVGKTASLLQRNKNLTEFLYKNHSPRIPAWYLEETGINPFELAQLAEKCGGNESLLRRALERLWKAETLRVMSFLLAQLWESVDEPKGKYWFRVRAVGKSEKILSPIWDVVQNISGLLFGSERAEAFDETGQALAMLFEKELYHDIQQCLLDFKGAPVYPVVGIEPIDSPESELEKNPQMAELMIRSLMNAYRNNFVPSKRQRILVLLSLPWHRYKPRFLDQPQHTSHLVGRFRWSAGSLRRFMNLRIESEFSRSHRRFTPKGNMDAWSALFGTRILNTYCVGKVTEDTFSYFVRHTHYRPRDLQRLAREAVRHQMVHSESDAQDVLMGRGGTTISPKNIRAAVRKEAENAAEERITEAQRLYPEVRDALEAVRGMQVPCTTDDLLGRFISSGVLDGGGSEFMELNQKLWDCGFIGIELMPKSHETTKFVEATFGNKSIARFEKYNREQHRYFLFEHTADRPITEILDQLRSPNQNGFDKNDIQVVFHPMMFEKFGLHPTNEYPIGI